MTTNSIILVERTQPHLFYKKNKRRKKNRKTLSFCVLLCHVLQIRLMEEEHEAKKKIMYVKNYTFIYIICKQQSHFLPRF